MTKTTCCDTTCCCSKEEVNVPITGISIPFCGFGVNIDVEALKESCGGVSREEIIQLIEGAMKKHPRYFLCEFYYLRHPDLYPGFQPAQGGLITDAATRYPEAWAYLQTAKGQKLCLSESEWQSMTHAVWHTNADGSKVGFDGIGGAPFYVQDLTAGTLRLPDLRGMYAEAAGFDGLAVGGIHGDAIREIIGDAPYITTWTDSAPALHAFKWMYRRGNGFVPTGTSSSYDYLRFEASRTVPTANKNAPRAWGANACVYLGEAQ